MKKLSSLLTVCLCFIAIHVFAYENNINRSVAAGCIPGDNVLRYYRLALPVTKTSYEEDLGSDYNNVLQFWQECEDFVNRMFVPLGFCFDVVTDESLVMSDYNLIDENIYNAPAFGTDLLNEAIGSNSYDVGMWVHHRSIYDENSGLSVEGGAYSNSTKGGGYAKTDKWVVAHEIGHLFGASHTATGEGSLMDSFGEFFSFPSIKRIRKTSAERNAAYYSDETRNTLVGVGNGGNFTYGVKVENSAPAFVSARMNDTYRIPAGACMAIPVFANDAEGDNIAYAAIGCSSNNVDEINGDDGMMPHFASLPPQASNVIDYRPTYVADIYDEEFYLIQEGTDIPSMYPGSYDISIIVNDIPQNTDNDILGISPFYSNYSVWNATVQIVEGTPFDASMTPAKDNYSAGDEIVVNWGVNSNYFTADSRLRITMSANYGKSFDYVLAESVPALDGRCSVVLPNVNIENVDVDFSTAIRSMRGGVIRIEEIDGVAYTLTTPSPDNGGGFTVKAQPGVSVEFHSIGKTSLINGFDDKGIAVFSAPQPTALPENVKAYYVIEKDIKENYVTLVEYNGATLPANEGFILIGEPGSMVLSYADSEPEGLGGTENKLGNTADGAKELADDECFLLVDGDDGLGFYACTSGTLAQYKAYLKIPASNVVRSIVINSPNVTGINKIQNDDETNGKIYDMTGRIMENISTPGIYITNGKKRLVE